MKNLIFLFLIILTSCQYGVEKNLISLETGGVQPANTSQKYIGQAPGLLQSEDFIDAKPGISHADFDSGNNGNSYRNNVDADIYPWGNQFVVGSSRPGEWLKYFVIVKHSGQYELYALLASADNAAQFELSIDESFYFNTQVENTGGWRKFKDHHVGNVYLEEGLHEIKIFMSNAGDTGHVADFDHIRFKMLNCGDDLSYPVTGSRHFLPGIIEVQLFDDPLIETSYNDQELENLGNTFRLEEGVDVYPDQKGAYFIGHTHDDESLEYSVSIQNDNNKQLLWNLDLATVHNRANVVLELFNQNQELVFEDVINVNSTNSWSQYKAFLSQSKSYKSGNYVLKITFKSSAQDKLFLVNFKNLALREQTSVDPNIKTLPFDGQAQIIPGSLELERYDVSVSEEAYVDSSQGNNGNSFRNDDVDIYQHKNQHFVGWIKTGERLSFTINVQEQGLYQVYAKSASMTGGGRFELSTDQGASAVLSNEVPATGGFRKYQTWKAMTIFLNQGENRIHVNFVQAGSDSWVGDFDNLIFTQENIIATGKSTRFIDGRRYLLHIPTNYNPFREHPLIVSSHGTNQNGDTEMDANGPNSGFDRGTPIWPVLSNQLSAIVATPDMQGAFGNEQGSLAQGQIDLLKNDENFIVQIVQRTKNQYKVDNNKVLLTGFSGGGHVVHYVGLRHPELFSHLSSRHGNFHEDLAPSNLQAVLNMPIQLFSGQDDPVQGTLQANHWYQITKGFQNVQFDMFTDSPSNLHTTDRQKATDWFIR